MDEDRILRARHADLAIDADRADMPPSVGGQPLLVQTKTVTSYPTSAGRYYAVTVVDPDGVEGEGNVATFSVRSVTFYALNIGSAVPPSGTKRLFMSMDPCGPSIDAVHQCFFHPWDQSTSLCNFDAF